MIDTDVPASQWKGWRAQLEAGAKIADAPRKLPTEPPKYDTVGGTHGVAFLSDPIEIEPGKTYVLSFDMKGKWSGIFFPKVFVKGYATEGGQLREKYRMYKACRTKSQGRQWEHFERTFHPTDGTPDVTSIRVQIYAYWPPGISYFDNVSVQDVSEE